MDVATEDGGLLNFDPVACPDLTADLATDDHRTRLDLSLDPGALTDDQGIRGVDFPAEDSTDSDGAQKAELSLELTSGFDNSRDG